MCSIQQMNKVILDSLLKLYLKFPIREMDFFFLKSDDRKGTIISELQKIFW